MVEASMDSLETTKPLITLAGCESAAVAYICKANNIESIIIKGILDDETNKNQVKSNEEQINILITITPLVMNKICKEYLNNNL